MERIDVISKLPAPILEHILSFLAIKDAARTSVLSKTWNNAWTSLSCLDFGYGFYHVIRGVVDQILEKRLNQKISIKRFKTMKISSNRLKYLKVVSCGNLTEVDLDTPNLLVFSSDVRYGKDIVDPLPTFHLKASRVLEASLNLIPETLDTSWYSKLTRSLSNFIHSKTIKLCCDNHKVLVIPKELRESFLPPLYDTNILQVKLHDQSNYSVVDIIDSMLWISPQLDTLSFGHTVDLKTLKFTYRDAADDEDEKPCCASLPWKCWRHELKKVTLQDFTIMELLELRDYFLTNTDKLETIEDPPGWFLRTSLQYLHA